MKDELSPKRTKSHQDGQTPIEKDKLPPREGKSQEEAKQTNKQTNSAEGPCTNTKYKGINIILEPEK